MRELTESHRLARFMEALGRAARGPARVYFTGGASAVLLGWRQTTIDIDFTILPEQDALLRAAVALKDQLHLNIEVAAPSHFIPELPGWEARSVFVRQEGPVSFYHYDFYAQTLAKIERGHQQDTADVAAMLDGRLVDPALLRVLFEAIVPSLFRYPALDESAFRRALDRALEGRTPTEGRPAR
jgi:hypothetical protein